MGVAGLIVTAPRLAHAEESTAANDAAAPGTHTATLAPVTVTAPLDAVPTVGYQPRASSIAGPGDAPLTDIPQSVSVVSAQVIQDQSARSLDDILANVSGLVQTNTLGGTRDSFLKRGFGTNDDGSILRDGVRSPLLHNYPVTLDRVEVLKGPASLLYGIQGPGGVINMVTRKPEDTFSGSVSYLHSSHAQNTGSLDLTGPLADVAGGKLSFRLTGEVDEAPYWRTSGGVNRHSLIAPSLAWHDANTSILLNYQYTDYTAPFDRGTVLVNGHPRDDLRYVRYEEGWAQSSGIQETANVRVEHKFNDAWRMRAIYGWARDRYDQYLTRASAFNSNTGAMTRSSDANLGRNDSENLASLSLLGDVATGPLRHQLMFGFEYERQRDFRGDTIRGRATPGFNLFAPVYGLLSPGGVPSATQSDSLSRVTSYSGIFQDAVHIGERWIVSAGLRFQHYEQLSGVGRPFVVNDNSHGQKWLPQLGAVYKLTPAVSLYANYARSFVPNVSSNALTALAPETGRIYETGVKLEMARGLTSTLSVFQIDKQNVAVTVGDVTSTIGRARSRGVELDVAGQITPNFSVIGNYAYTDTRDLDNDVPLVNAPRHMGGLLASYAMAFDGIPGRWRLGGGARFVGARAGDAANSFTLPGYGVVDAFLAYDTRLNSFPTRIQLNVKNLLNKAYYPSSASNLIVAVAEPRVVLLTTTLSF